jgi:hypothetical protein
MMSTVSWGQCSSGSFGTEKGRVYVVCGLELFENSASDGLEGWRKDSDVEYSQDVGMGAERENYLKIYRSEKINGLIIVRQVHQDR